MGKKRKRPEHGHDHHRQQHQVAKRVKDASGIPPLPPPPTLKNNTDTPTATNPVLSLYYSRVVKLRTHLLDQLPLSSKSRRRKVASLGLPGTTCSNNRKNHPIIPPTTTSTTTNIITKTTPPVHEATATKQGTHTDGIQAAALADILDSTLVGVLRESDHIVNQRRQREFAAYTQSQARSLLVSTDIGATTCQSEIVDFAIHTLFKKHPASYHTPSHLLCHGFQRARPNQEHNPLEGILGIVPQYPNKNASMLKNSPWTDVLGLLGKNCEEIMLHLLLDCGLFIQANKERETYYQLSGVQLSELKLLTSQPIKSSEQKQTPLQTGRNDVRTPKDIVFVRRRLLYARPALNTKGQPRFGLRHTHVLNRYPDPNDLKHTVHVMKYIFPRQFGLHNVFTSHVDSRETTEQFKDYTLREEEITSKQPDAETHQGCKIPKRLRGELVALIQKLQKRHRLCSYTELFKYYCPIEDSQPQPNSGQSTPLTDSEKRGGNTNPVSMTDYATPPAAVSAFCRAVLQKLIPNDLFGMGEDGARNRDIVMRHIDTFIHLRRFESLSLHEVSQGLKITCVKWLEPPHKEENGAPSAKLSVSDIRKRTEIFLEFIYYIFDSLLMPLIRSNFYVTESGVHRNRMFYFRHDIWRKLAEPSMSRIKESMFEEVHKENAEKILASRTLGFSLLRLLPKSTGARPIMNLRRRSLKKNAWGSYLGASINSLMTPMFNALSYEKTQQAEKLGSTLFNVNDMYGRIKDFKEKMVQKKRIRTKPFYLVKVDIQSCFDTIPQHRLLQLVDQLISEDEYRVTRHVEIRPLDHPISTDAASNHKTTNAKPVRKYVSKANGLTDFTTLHDTVTSSSSSSSFIRAKKHTVFVDTAMQKRHEADRLLSLLEEHVRNNLVQIDKQFFRQKNGIPQGSILSTLLCNFFYAAHERENLSFLHSVDEGDDASLLLRLVDDYLLITTSTSLATQFLQTMLDGDAEYGITVNPAKSLTNFTAAINGRKIPRLPPEQEHQFPYCGTLIDTRTLSLRKDPTPKDAALTVPDTLTVDATKAPGATFVRKLISFFKINVAAMFLDTSHNSTPVVLASIYQNFLQAAIKAHAYLGVLRTRRLSRRTQQQRAQLDRLLRQAIAALLENAVCIIRSRVPACPSSNNKSSGSRDTSSATTSSGFQCAVSKSQIRFLGAAAFKGIFKRKQTLFPETLRWLDAVSREVRPVRDADAVMLLRAVRDGGSGVRI
ncbi:hypothetical protein AJ80_00463 [Polytolypa hystricis UAMH7299]|uniref:Telomerase reverse transcriptase n=1 Tax=Polytolypa hystricis (strain UAMH7299) TaxID=1447883 RepID=A0A2B7Z3V0_POLH7|nr:hypothetical protein AJ80_00463 [Polytolypa hystricis UAMH7299]